MFSSGDASLFFGSSLFGSLFVSFLNVPVSGFPFGFAGVCGMVKDGVGETEKNLRNMRVFALTSLLRAPPPSDGAELMADPGRLPDSEPEICLVQRQREYWSGTCHSCGWCGLDWGSTRGAALGLNSKSMLSTLLSREWS